MPHTLFACSFAWIGTGACVRAHDSCICQVLDVLLLLFRAHCCIDWSVIQALRQLRASEAVLVWVLQQLAITGWRSSDDGKADSVAHCVLRACAHQALSEVCMCAHTQKETSAGCGCSQGRVSRALVSGPHTHTYTHAHMRAQALPFSPGWHHAVFMLLVARVWCWPGSPCPLPPLCCWLNTPLLLFFPNTYLRICARACVVS